MVLYSVPYHTAQVLRFIQGPVVVTLSMAIAKICILCMRSLVFRYRNNTQAIYILNAQYGYCQCIGSIAAIVPISKLRVHNMHFAAIAILSATWSQTVWILESIMSLSKTWNNKHQFFQQTTPIFALFPLFSILAAIQARRVTSSRGTSHTRIGKSRKYGQISKNSFL